MSGLDQQNDSSTTRGRDSSLACPIGGDAVITTDVRGRITGMNRVAESLSGRLLIDSQGKALTEIFVIVHPGTGMDLTDLVAEIVETDLFTGLSGRAVLVSQTGTAYPIADTVTPILDSRGQTAGLVLVFQDGTERNQTRTAEGGHRNGLCETRAELEAIINALPGLVSVVDREFNVLVANDAVVETFGQGHMDEVIGRKCYRVRKGLEDICPQCGIKRAMDNDETVVRISTPEEEQSMGIATKAYAIPLKDDNGNIWGGVEVIMDVTDLKEAEKAIRENEVRFRTVIEQGPTAVYLSDMRGRIVDVNQRSVDQLGYTRESLLKKTVMELNEGYPTLEALSAHWSGLEMGESIRLESNHIKSDGTVFPVEIRTSVIEIKGERYILGFVEDISERKRAEAERQKFEQHVQQTQKLESLGVLAGGIAHDFNNLLGGIFGYIDLAKEESRDEVVSQYLAKSLGTIDRARGLTQQLLTFSKGGAPVKKVMHLFPFVEETVRFALSESRVVVTFEVPSGLRACDIDSTQIGQVISNIVINAKQAMPMGGSLAIIAENLSSQGTENPALGSGDYVKLTFGDSGIGMPPEMLPSIFDPFFTTKQMGSGLGLATCYSIVKKHNGHIEVASEPGMGTTVSVYLPAFIEPMDRPLTPRRESPEERGRILVMDDEKVIQETTHAMCRSLGYGVVVTSSGQEVVRVLTDEIAAGRSFTALILDLTVPGAMGGREAIREIRKIDADVPVFVSSGYADDPVMANPGEYQFNGSLRKPFRRKDLKALFGRHLDPLRDFQ